ncbi:4Fe-4S dicluster domain-containing protein [Nocardioides caldifontis]|uniref:4Fe-4S dicluster domain-containing protein n=1 Tax=Nocardioides caldifontis TaxID=2588938 RepID=UPI0011DFCC09|nr:4Fe-4S dicluster domain-containing protein [Nocardioides caldifontis]
MRYGFAIDQRTCIGCHACTVACKTEHQVPVGQFRTWVKYVDSGTFPDSKRDFGVMRCNHCTDAPCGKICPTNALFTRDDGIVDFDSGACIGCKSCMQACPYDAIYIDDDTKTAAKCNFCAHRIDDGLEPACVVVCPTHSIWVGDLEDESSGIAQLVASAGDVAVRAPDQGTGPNVFYLGAAHAVLEPLEAPVRDTYLWARPDALRLTTAGDFEGSDPTAATTLNTSHPRPWGWRVATYLWAKGVGAGALFVAALAAVLGIDLGWAGDLGAPVVGAVAAAATGILLVWDLKRPDRFYFLFTRGNQGSWLVLGGYCLLAFGAACVAWFVAGLADAGGVHQVLGWPAFLAAVMAAGYTAMLFAQAEGRDLWQSRWLFPHLLAQAAMTGAGAMAVLLAAGGADGAGTALASRVLVVGAALHVVLTLLDLGGRHHSRRAEVAARTMLAGRYRTLLWGGAIAPTVVALAVAALSWNGDLAWTAALGGVLVQPALLVYESVYLKAGQDVPLS